MTKEELIDFLKDNLSITIEENFDYYGGDKNINVKLMIGNEEISSEYFTIPSND